MLLSLGGILLSEECVGILEVLVVLLGLSLVGLLTAGGLDVLGGVDVALLVGLLDGDAATEGTGLGGVAAADGAEVSGGTADAVEVLGHGDLHDELLGADLGQTVGAGDVVRDAQVLEVCTDVAGLVQIADVRSGAVGVDLVDGHGDHGTRLDRGDLLGGESVLALLTRIDVAVQLRPTAEVYRGKNDLLISEVFVCIFSNLAVHVMLLTGDVGLDLGLPDDGGVLLARADAYAITGDLRNYLEADRGRRALLTLGVEDDRVSVGQSGQGGKEECLGEHLDRLCGEEKKTKKRLSKGKSKECVEKKGRHSLLVEMNHRQGE